MSKIRAIETVCQHVQDGIAATAYSARQRRGSLTRRGVEAVYIPAVPQSILTPCSSTTALAASCTRRCIVHVRRCTDSECTYMLLV